MILIAEIIFAGDPFFAENKKNLQICKKRISGWMICSSDRIWQDLAFLSWSISFLF